MKDAHAGSLQQTLADLDRAFRNFFDPNIRARHPKYKSKKRDEDRFRMPQRVRLEDDNRIYVPKVGMVRIRKSRPIDGMTKSATFKRDACGRWFVTFVVVFEMPDAPLCPPDPSMIIGIDVGLKDYVTFSDDTPSVPAPKFFRTTQRRLRKAHRRFSRRKAGSNRKAKARLTVAKVHAKIAQQRGDFQHKLSASILNLYEGVCVEDLDLRSLARTKQGVGKSFLDAGFGDFFHQLKYKAEANHRHFTRISRWYPSSKLHADCGTINSKLTLNDRTWICECGAVLDRDKNAACNIRDEGIRILAAGYADKENARGRAVRPATVGSPG